jgi:alpha-beta hydrolase superfamily lysophospholipase
MTERLDTPLAQYGDLSYADLQALVDRARQERSKAARAYVHSLGALIQRAFVPHRPDGMAKA